jgi:hypothetical protein
MKKMKGSEQQSQALDLLSLQFDRGIARIAKDLSHLV